MAEAGALDGGDAVVWVRDLLGADSQPAVRLSEILSKAFLLAADTRIRDDTILRQLR